MVSEFLTRLEEQNSFLVEVKVNEMVSLVCYVRTCRGKENELIG